MLYINLPYQSQLFGLVINGQVQAFVGPLMFGFNECLSRYVLTFYPFIQDPTMVPLEHSCPSGDSYSFLYGPTLMPLAYFSTQQKFILIPLGSNLGALGTSSPQQRFILIFSRFDLSDLSIFLSPIEIHTHSLNFQPQYLQHILSIIEIQYVYAQWKPQVHPLESNSNSFLNIISLSFWEELFTSNILRLF